MEATKLRRYQERLIEERGRVVDEMDRIRESIPDEVHPPGEHEIAPSEGLEVDISLATGEEKRLRDIDRALLRIKEGTFGKCSRCGHAISATRLDAIPEATHCMRCENLLRGS